MVSVLVPVYNKSQKELRRCFESILRQTYTEIELIITDDGSNSGVADFLDDYVKINKTRCSGGVSCFHYENDGVWVARNRGQERASGEWIMHVNADDFISPVTIDTALKMATKFENVDMVYWGLWTVDYPLYLYKGCGGDRLYSNPTKEKFYIRRDILCATPFCDVTCMVRHKKMQPFLPDLDGAENEHQVRLISRCRAIYFIDRPFYNYVPNKDTITNRVDINWYIETINDFRKALINYDYKTIDEYLIVYAANTMRLATDYDFSIYQKISRSAVGKIIRSRSINEFNPLTRKMRAIYIFIKARQLFLLSIILWLEQKLTEGKKDNLE